MASGLEEELSCPVCRDIFRDPVFLSCSHSFCKNCLKRWWRKKQMRECPVCKTSSGSKRPHCNLVLKNTCEAFLREKASKAASESEYLCSLHSEKLKLFCVDHQQPVCLICRDSKSHKNHRFRPIREAAQDYRKELQESLSLLQENLKLFHQVKGNYDQTAEHIQVQAQSTETEIRKQFQKLHLFLQEEEDARVIALRKEEEQKSEIIKEKTDALSREIAALSDTARVTEEKLRAADVSFLQSYKAAVERVQQCSHLNGPQLDSGALIDEAKHLGNLTFSIWNKMKEVVSYTPVILDPNTAEAGLILSEDLMSVRCGERQKLPENPERFDCHGMILASEGFNSGTHRWTVEVGDSTAWFVGVVAQTFRRKGCTDIKSGLWAVAFSKGKYVIISPPDPSPFHPERKLQAISVHLDCERGGVSFFNAETNTHIHSLTHTCTETLFPVFYTGSKFPLKILPQVFDDNGDSSSDDGAQAVNAEGGGDIAADAADFEES
ncbi:E3 ubiquitin-protein ligase TRIM35-like [Melanotaenia boesemani]|uniref:E3 ubiquitin-protein ligase TRIM35-like n=1 Tax=Melanotaenia boesemani TaxID=1250792 RepID=UPI001C04465B|nr:E3 ubiquitin-protein ligase TRIM35-like [Melanotaenia boesemani]